MKNRIRTPLTNLAAYVAGILLLTGMGSIADEGGKHLFILSGQSNMARLDPNEAFTPAMNQTFGKNNVIVVHDAKGGQPIRRWYKKWKSATGNEPAPAAKAPARRFKRNTVEDGTANRSTRAAARVKRRSANRRPATPATNGDLYDRMMKTVAAATKGRTIKTVTFVWMQGEADSKSDGEVYAASLRGLIDQLGKDLNRKDLNFVIGRLSDHSMDNRRFPHWTMVREAQVVVAETDPRGAWVDTDNLNSGTDTKGKKVEDGLHYSVEGYKTLGQRFAAAAISLIKKDGK
jgi:hypothetical protein